MDFQRIARWCWRSWSSTGSPQCDIVDSHCQNGSMHARPASISTIRISTSHADLQIWSPTIVYAQVSRCTWVSINCRNSLNAWHVTVLRPVEKPETSGSPLKVLSWHSIQRIKHCVTQTAEEVQQNTAEHVGNYVHSGLRRKKGFAFLLITLMVR